MPWCWNGTRPEHLSWDCSFLSSDDVAKTDFPVPALRQVTGAEGHAQDPGGDVNGDAAPPKKTRGAVFSELHGLPPDDKAKAAASISAFKVQHEAKLRD